MVTFALLIKCHPQVAEWRCALVEYGGQCAMTCGMKEMLQLYAESWDLVTEVHTKLIIEPACHMKMTV